MRFLQAACGIHEGLERPGDPAQVGGRAQDDAVVAQQAVWGLRHVFGPDQFSEDARHGAGAVQHVVGNVRGVAVGMGTVGAPLLVMQPAMSSGFAASRTPTPLKSCLRSLANHTVFGLGLYLSALVIALISR